MSSQIQLIVAVYVLPFAALFAASLVMEVYDRVAEWLRREGRGES